MHCDICHMLHYYKPAAARIYFVFTEALEENGILTQKNKKQDSKGEQAYVNINNHYITHYFSSLHFLTGCKAK